MTHRQIYTAKDVAAIYQVSIRRARYLAQLRGIGTKVGGKICFTWAEIKALKPGKPGYPKGRPRGPMMDDGPDTGPILETSIMNTEGMTAAAVDITADTLGIDIEGNAEHKLST